MIERFILLLLAGILAGFALLGVAAIVIGASASVGLSVAITTIIKAVLPIISAIAVIAIVIFALCIIYKVLHAKFHKKC